jgi:hypothetical protein
MERLAEASSLAGNLGDILVEVVGVEGGVGGVKGEVGSGWARMEVTWSRRSRGKTWGFRGLGIWGCVSSWI